VQDFTSPLRENPGLFLHRSNASKNRKVLSLFFILPDMHQPPASATSSTPRRSPSRHEMVIIDYIRQFTPLSDLEVQGILDNIRIKVFKKGQMVLREGQIANLCYFILKGCVRQFYLIDGVEKTTHFYTEGQPVTPYQGTHKRNPSRYYLQAVEETITTIGTPEAEAQLFSLFPRFEQIARIATEEELGKSQENMAAFITSSPEDRYRHLLHTRPDLLERVPQYQLASYLGVTPESLSRIRKRIQAK
jgi:CRP-like cAMP-binding protein